MRITEIIDLDIDKMQLDVEILTNSFAGSVYS